MATGLAPAEGDEILQIGAVRVLRGRVLRHEACEPLVDPQRHIPAAGIPIHGITPEMVRGQPVLEASRRSRGRSHGTAAHKCGRRPLLYPLRLRFMGNQW